MPSSPCSSHSPGANPVGAIGRRVTALRRQAGLSRKDLAATAGMSSHSLIKVERGASGPSFGATHALAAGLGVDPVAFFTDSDINDLVFAGSESPAFISPASRPELVPPISLLGLGQFPGRVTLTPFLSALLRLDGLRQGLSLDGFLECHVVPADRRALKLDLENQAAGVPVQVWEARLLLASGARIVFVVLNAGWLLEQTDSGVEGLPNGASRDHSVWMTVMDVTCLDAVLRDHSASQFGQNFLLEELIREKRVVQPGPEAGKSRPEAGRTDDAGCTTAVAGRGADSPVHETTMPEIVTQRHPPQHPKN
ncbi:MAG: XRE family transcriptional regulator [Desulfovibrionales bacterium]|nr:MAG: XRE family transcriptional regulator [Desulfovibrionales bacterium]